MRFDGFFFWVPNFRTNKRTYLIFLRVPSSPILRRTNALQEWKDQAALEFLQNAAGLSYLGGRIAHGQHSKTTIPSNLEF
jgi:hypothetical protein